MKPRLTAIALCSILFSTNAALGAPKDKLLDIDVAPRYVWFAYSNGVSSIYETLSGALRRYERSTQTWQTFTLQDIFGTSFEADVKAVATDGDRTVWVGVEPLVGHTIPYACAFSHDNGAHWTVRSASDGLAANAVKCIAIDPVTQAIWVGHGLNDATHCISSSTDGGTTWTTFSPNSDYGIIEIAAYDAIVWAAADYNGYKPLMKSIDRGNSWQYFDSSDTPALCDSCDVTDLCMVSPDEVHCTVYTEFSANSSSGAYCYTLDGGATWQTRQVKGYQDYGQTVAVEPWGTVWLGQRWYPPETIYRSEDSGQSWQGFNITTDLPYDDPFVIRYDPYAKIVWAGFWGNSFTNYQSAWCWTGDDGNTWHTDAPPPILFSGLPDSMWQDYR